ncbi:MAG TPA: BON domain-containing protein [Gammaproteobacteria bacterium]|jgi:hyperosmotically inducible protein|nr:BON domain-containing protein [Gammaproteobacteria bacterium]
MKQNYFLVCSKIFLLCLIVLFTTKTFAESSKTVVTDSVITAKVKSKILLDKNLSAFKINVTTQHGVVMLSGNVDSNSQAGQAVEIAQATTGVKNVDVTQLTIKESDQPFTDTLITSKIKGLLIREQLFDENISAMSIHVETNNGVVYLTGIATSKAQLDNAIKVAKSVDGVLKVESTVKVAPNV